MGLGEDQIYKNHSLSFPKEIYTDDINSDLHKFLRALSEVDAEHSQDIQNAIDQKFLKRAGGKWLEAKGANYNIPRPSGFNMSDDTYRKLIKLMSFHERQTMTIIEKLLDLFFGEDSLAKDLAKIYSVDEGVIEIVIKKYAIIIAARRDLIGATYLHGNHELAENEFYSGYIFGRAVLSTLSPPSIGAGQNTLNISQNEDKFPIDGECICIGTKDSNNWEARYYSSRVGDELHLSRPTNKAHISGENIYIPQYITKHEIFLTQNIYQGQSYSQITTSNSSDFPDTEGVVWFDYHNKKKRERVPYIARINNGTITLDHSYVFKNNYVSGARITLCAKSRYHDIKGTDYAFYINGTSELQGYIENILHEVKAEGIRLRTEFV